MKNYLFLSMFLMSLMVGAQKYTLKVWPDGAPDSNGMTLAEDHSSVGRVGNISEAELYIYLPDENLNTGVAVVICPGGGYIMEAINHEGHDMAKWLAAKGVAGIVLKYRLPYGHHSIPSDDTRRAIRLVRMNATRWNISPEKIGIAGSSAGGHLASTAGTVFDRGNPSATDPLEKISCRPDFMLLLYPVITMKEEFTHAGSRKNLLGEGYDKTLVLKYSNEMNVTRDTPPTFLVLADDDKTVIPRNSVDFYSELKKNGIPAEMHIFAKGGHGFGMRKNNIPVDKWPDLFMDWLKATGFVQVK